MVSGELHTGAESPGRGKGAVKGPEVGTTMAVKGPKTRTVGKAGVGAHVETKLGSEVHSGRRPAGKGYFVKNPSDASPGFKSGVGQGLTLCARFNHVLQPNVIRLLLITYVIIH